MKSTTKILIGILFSGVLLVIISSVLLFFIVEKEQKLVFGGETISVDVLSFRAVNISINKKFAYSQKDASIYSSLNISPAVNGKQQFTYPKEMDPFVSVEHENDTLNICFNVSESNLPDSYKDRNWVFMYCSEMTLTFDPSLIIVQSDVPQLKVSLSEIISDSMTLNARYIQVDSCRFDALYVQSSGDIGILNSQIKSVYLDLDGIGQWNVTNCQIENEHLTGSGHHYNVLQKGECKQLYWTPKQPDAELHITLKEESRVLLTK